MTKLINKDEFPHSDFAEQNTLMGAQHYPRWMSTEIKLCRRLARLINAPSPE